MATNAKRLQLKITLRDVEPQVWRRLVVAPDLTLAQLHDAIQSAFGWQDNHLHEFRVGDFRYGRPDYEDGFPGDGPALGDERKAPLALALRGQRKLEYWYDFGDDWWHDIVVEAVLDADARAPAKALVAGERACPPEDCGGPPGFSDLLAALRDPAHPEHAELREWAGRYDPDKFDLDRAARAVSRARRAR
ncbi:MAG: plasmid pRiA4b ORF-3 family protein [Betaproteobacteria bacterium]